MEIRHYLGVLGRRGWVVVLVTLLSLGVVVFGLRVRSPAYTASALVRISQVTNRPIDYSALTYTERVKTTYVRMLTTRPFLAQVAGRLGLSASPEELAGMVEAELLVNTDLLQISATHPHPQMAAAIANALADLLVEEGQRIFTGPGRTGEQVLRDQVDAVQRDLEDQRAHVMAQLAASGLDGSELQQEVRARLEAQEAAYASLLNEYDIARSREALLANSVGIVERAVPPSRPSGLQAEHLAALAVVLGLVGGTGLAFLAENLDPTIHSAERLAGVGNLVVLGAVPRFGVPRQKGGDALLVTRKTHSFALEALRAVQSAILSSVSEGGQRGGATKTLLVASAECGEGKSTLVANLAALMARGGRRVIAVDSDVRQPSLHRLFGLPNGIGLTDAVSSPRAIDLALQETVIPGLRVMTSGPSASFPVELLASERMRAVVQELTRQADVVLFDSPPILAAADALGLAGMVDAVVLVAARRGVTQEQLREALRQLQRAGANVLGAVLTKAGAGAKPLRYPWHVTAEPWQGYAEWRSGYVAWRQGYDESRRGRADGHGPQAAPATREISGAR